MLYDKREYNSHMNTYKHSVKKLLIGIVCAAVVGTIVYVTKTPPVVPTLSQEQAQQTSTQTTSGTPTTPTTPKTPVKSQTPTTPPVVPSGISMTQIALHNSRESCWSAINDSVYDLTSWIPNHPGGESAILRLCGKDGSSDYNGQHGKSTRVARILGGFKIGALAQ